MRASQAPHLRELPLVNSRSGADLLGPGMSDRDVTWRAFLQQQFRRLNARLGVKPFAHSPVKENVGDGNHAHALMMRHECPHDRKPGSLGQTAAGVIERLKEAVTTARANGNESREIERRALRINHRGQGRCVRRDHRILAQTPFEPQARHAEIRVLVGKLDVARVIGRFRHAPGNAELCTVLYLPLNNQTIGLFEKAAERRTHDKRGHQVFEHRSGPGYQRGPMSNWCGRASEPKPVAGRYLVHGDGHEACQTRLGSE